MNTPRGTPEQIAAAHQACIDIMKASIEHSKKYMAKLEAIPPTERTDEDYKTYKRVWKDFLAQEAELRMLTGEQQRPEKEKKKARNMRDAWRNAQMN